MIVILPIVFSIMSTGALAFSSHSHSNKSVPAGASTSTTSTTLTRQAQQTQAQQQQQQEPSQSLSSRSESSRPTRRKSALAFSPTDIGDAATLLSLKVDVGAKAMAQVHTSPTQVLTDFSYVLFDPHKFFPNIKISKLRMRYAQVFGRLMILGTSVLPHHHGIIHPEEMAVQLYLLSVSLKPILRSMELYKCMADAKKDGSTSTTTTNCVEECALELEELEASLDIKNVV